MKVILEIDLATTLERNRDDFVAYFKGEIKGWELAQVIGETTETTQRLIAGLVSAAVTHKFNCSSRVIWE